MKGWLQAIGGGIVDGLRARGPGSLDAPAKIVKGEVTNGDVNILTIKAYNGANWAKQADIKEYVTQFDIYENIVSPAIYGVLHVKDGVRLAELFEFKAGDIVQIRFQTPGAQTSEYIFKVNTPEMNKRILPNLSIEAYEIELVSVEAFEAQTIKVESLSLKDTAGKVIENILSEYIDKDNEIKAARSLLGREFITRYDLDSGYGIIGKNKQQVKVLPKKSAGDYYRPFQAIHMMAMLNNESPAGESLYTFFERKDGFYFKPIEKLIKKGKSDIDKGESDKIFYYDHLRNQDQTSVKFRNILAYSIIKTDSGVEDTITTNSNINPETGENSKPITAEPDSTAVELTSAEALKRKGVTRVDTIVSTEFDHLAKVTGKRRMLLSRIMQYEAQIMIYGDTNMSVGDVIECNFTQASGTAKESSEKDQLSNLSKDAAPYLITHLRHSVLNTDRPQHVISCNLLRAKSVDKR